jgi:hypothetical protein
MPPQLKKWALQPKSGEVLNQTLTFTCLSKYRIDNNYLPHFITSITQYFIEALPPDSDMDYMIGEQFAAAYPTLKEQQGGVHSIINLSVSMGWISTIASKLDDGYVIIPISAPTFPAPIPITFMVTTDKGASLCGPSSVVYETCNWPDFYSETEIEKQLLLLGVKCDFTITRKQSIRMPGRLVIGAWTIEGPASLDLPPHIPIYGQKLWVRLDLTEVKGDLDCSGLVLVSIPAIPLLPRPEIPGNSPPRHLTPEEQENTQNKTQAAALKRAAANGANGRNGPGGRGGGRPIAPGEDVTMKDKNDGNNDGAGGTSDIGDGGIGNGVVEGNGDAPNVSNGAGNGVGASARGAGAAPGANGVGANGVGVGANGVGANGADANGAGVGVNAGANGASVGVNGVNGVNVAGVNAGVTGSGVTGVGAGVNGAGANGAGANGAGANGAGVGANGAGANGAGANGAGANDVGASARGAGPSTGALGVVVGAGSESIDEVDEYAQGKGEEYKEPDWESVPMDSRNDINKRGATDEQSTDRLTKSNRYVSLSDKNE